MKLIKYASVLITYLTLSFFLSSASAEIATSKAASEVLQRALGKQISKRFILKLDPTKNSSLDHYSIQVKNNLIHVKSNTAVGLIRGSYAYLKTQHHSIINWSGSRIQLPKKLKPYTNQHSTPYQYRYYFNVVTHGYSTAYWDWQRWEREIDWMTLHGINMPLIGGAHEAILDRVFRKLGLNQQQSYAYFSGPAHFPWNRMGNLIGWDGADQLPQSYFEQQIALNHKILNRLRELGMSPIVHAFAGFVPPQIKQLYPDADIRELGWGGGLHESSNGYILSPTSPLFTKIGKLYIEEWEKEFGKNTFYLADSFNEMDVPATSSEAVLLKELAGYGNSVHQSIQAANPDAIWVMQGWTFPYHKDHTGKLFWTPKRLNALVEKVPDHKLLILDLANEYNHVFWKIDPSWKMYQGFFNKQWIYSFIPNMGGKTPLNGRLDIYASIPIDALNYANKGNLVGFGFAPEGIENNEMIYELLSDMAWQTKAIDLKQWQQQYAIQRYGSYPQAIQQAYALLNQSALGTFTDHPIHRFQLRPYLNPEGVEDHATVHQSKIFDQAVGEFLKASKQLGQNTLYVHDAVELMAQYLGLKADDLLREFLSANIKNRNYKRLDEALEMLIAVDRLLVNHPNHQLNTWVALARTWGYTESDKDYYESNAKRLLTTWGGDPVNDYSGRVWSGLIRDYYVPRWQLYHQAAKNGQSFDLRAWEEQWIKTPYQASAVEPYQNPLKKAQQLFNKYSK